MSPSAQNALISQNYCLCQQGGTFKYPEQMQMIRVRKKQTHFNKKSSRQVLFCSYQYSTGCLEGRMLVPLAFKENDDYKKRSPACAEACSPAGSPHTILQPATSPWQQMCCPRRSEGQGQSPHSWLHKPRGEHRQSPSC